MTEMLDSANVDALAAQLHGGVTQPSDADYDEVRALYNAMIDKRPALIARCADVDDVVAAVNFGRENGLDIAIRGGGHNGGGLGSVDDGLMIDLSGLKGVEVDADARTATIAGGCLLREVDAATGEHGLATPVGFIGSTGAGGLMLGGGIGHLTRGYGLLILPAVSIEYTRQRRREREARPLLGDPRRRWQLRSRHQDPGAAASGQHGRRRPDVLAARQGGRRPPLVPRVHPQRAGGARRLVRVPQRPARPSVPGRAAPAEGRRDRLVLDWAGGRRRRSARGGAGAGRAPDGRCRPRSVRRLQWRVRRHLPGRRPVVLAGRLRRDDPGRGDREARRVRREAAQLEVDDAHVPDRRRTASGRPRRPGPFGTRTSAP